MVRLVSGIVMAVVALAAIVWVPASLFRAVIAVLAAVAASEYAALAGRPAGVGRTLVVLIAALAAWIVAEQPGRFPEAALAGLLVAAAVVLGRHTTVPSGMAALFGALYIGVPFGVLAHLRDAIGWQAAVLLVAVVAVSDSLQYYSGRMFGRRPLAPRVSPKKTVEGAVGGLVAAGLFLALAGPRVVPAISAPAFGLLGLVLAVLGICGDLFESQLKRAAGIKDSSHLIPGHGGVLDRVDALLFVTPAFFVAIRGAL